MNLKDQGPGRQTFRYQNSGQQVEHAKLYCGLSTAGLNAREPNLLLALDWWPAGTLISAFTVAPACVLSSSSHRTTRGAPNDTRTVTLISAFTVASARVLFFLAAAGPHEAPKRYKDGNLNFCVHGRPGVCSFFQQ